MVARFSMTKFRIYYLECGGFLLFRMWALFAVVFFFFYLQAAYKDHAADFGKGLYDYSQL